MNADDLPEPTLPEDSPPETDIEFARAMAWFIAAKQTSEFKRYLWSRGLDGKLVAWLKGVVR